jgi:transposase
VEQLEQGLALVEEQVRQLAQSDRHRKVVGALRCFRGVDTLTALSFICELYSFGRFRSARGLMNFLGLVPSEDSTGEATTRGGITKTGNRYVRHRHRPAVGQALRKRRQGQPAEAIAHADKAMLRLHRKFVRLTWRGKASNKITVALARELSGFLWAVTNQVCDQQQDSVA